VIWELRKGTALLRCRQEARLLRGLRTFSCSLGVFAFLLFPLLVRPPSHTPHTLFLGSSNRKTCAGVEVKVRKKKSYVCLGFVDGLLFFLSLFLLPFHPAPKLTVTPPSFPLRLSFFPCFVFCVRLIPFFFRRATSDRFF